MGALNLWTQNLRFVKIQIERRLFICNAAKAERIQLQEERFGAPGNRTPLVKSLVAKPSLKNKRLNKLHGALLIQLLLGAFCCPVLETRLY